jgi:S-adenosylmethionine:tRNA ribosyltransferase-isomerase
VLDRATGAIVDRHFSDIIELIEPGDALVVNETRVRPARLEVRSATGARVELLVVREEGAGTWRALARPAKRARRGVRLETADARLALEVMEEAERGERIVRVVHGELLETLEALGEVPLPPYIHRAPDATDRERYQTVFARTPGAVAAPTAGLHFTESLLAALRARGVLVLPILLHVGPGTFRPVAAADARKHEMDSEWFDVPEPVAVALREVRARGRRIVAVGTTAVRALESACDLNGGAIGPAAGWTRKYILPPYAFRAVDALITNFHLPRTTLLLLVAAFAGLEPVRAAYAHAVRGGYRFYSYGDAMLIR